MDLHFSFLIYTNVNNVNCEMHDQLQNHESERLNN